MSLPRQFFRYAVIGIGSNAILYLAYLALTAWGAGHKISMTLLYVSGVLQTFLFNKRWTFFHDGAHRGPFIRYLLSYLFGYLFNLAALLVLVDLSHWPHQIVQGVVIVILAAMLFLLQKYWVFAEGRS
ncbi:MAG: GtrA family protein [Nitrosomonadales bacterium]|nr:GtrA family protein [Nitrosomonadales bacterium]